MYLPSWESCTVQSNRLIDIERSFRSESSIGIIAGPIECLQTTVKFTATLNSKVFHHYLNPYRPFGGQPCPPSFVLDRCAKSGVAHQHTIP